MRTGRTAAGQGAEGRVRPMVDGVDRRSEWCGRCGTGLVRGWRQGRAGGYGVGRVGGASGGRRRFQGGEYQQWRARLHLVARSGEDLPDHAVDRGGDT